jgi:hypothetical protein
MITRISQLAVLAADSQIGRLIICESAAKKNNLFFCGMSNVLPWFWWII